MTSPVQIQNFPGIHIVVLRTDGVGDGHSDGIRQPSPAPGEPVAKGVGAAGGVGADQRLPSPPQVFRRLGQGELGSGDVIGGGVGARIAGPQQSRHRLPGPAWPGRDRRTRRAGGGRRFSSRSRWRPVSRSTQGPAPRRCPRSPGLRRPDCLPWPTPRPAAALRNVRRGSPQELSGRTR